MMGMSGLLKLTELGANMTVKNKRVKEVLELCSREEITQVGTGLIHQRLVNYDEFAQQIVGESIVAALCTDLKDITYTTYDRDMISSIVARVVDQIRNHWEFRDAY